MKIFLTGGTGMVGRNVLEHPKASQHQIYAPTRQQVDLLNYEQVNSAIKEYAPDLIIHTAGLVGGIQANKDALFDFMDKNMVIGLNVVRAARTNQVSRLINLGSTCMYPKDAPQPMTEDSLFTGPLEPTNEGYAIAKTAIQRACQYINQENKNNNYKTYIPCNLFGRHDHFDPETSHLLPAIIRKVHLAKEEIKKTGKATIEIWGSGDPRREVMDAADLADFIFFSLNIYDKVPDVLNVSPGEDMSIQWLYYTIASYLLEEKDKNKITWKNLRDKPDGMFRKLSCVKKMLSCGWQPPTSFEDSIVKAYKYFLDSMEEQKKENKVTNQRCAFITGVNGQDGSYLAEFLLAKNYKVVGMVRRNSQVQHKWMDNIIKHPDFHLEYGNMQDSNSLWNIISKHKPDEIYNLAAQSHVRISFDCPEETFDVVAMGTLRLLNAAKALVPSARIYQAGSSEQFGFNPENPQNEKTVFMPASPYGCAKVAAHNICINYRHAYNMFISVGILHNHESPRRGENFVTRKITKAAARIKLGLQDKLELGNLDAKRDWGSSKEYVEVMWKMLQHNEPDDFVVATGESHSVKEFLNEVFAQAGLDVEKHVVLNPVLMRPHEVNFLWGDSTKAEKVLGWKPATKFSDLAKWMYEEDLKIEQQTKEFLSEQKSQ